MMYTNSYNNIVISQSLFVAWEERPWSTGTQPDVTSSLPLTASWPGPPSCSSLYWWPAGDSQEPGQPRIPAMAVSGERREKIYWFLRNVFWWFDECRVERERILFLILESWERFFFVIHRWHRIELTVRICLTQKFIVLKLNHIS